MEELVAVSAWIDTRAAGGAADGGTVVRSPRYIGGVTAVAMEDGSNEIVDWRRGTAGGEEQRCQPDGATLPWRGRSGGR
jgi:hypothetical protein